MSGQDFSSEATPRARKTYRCCECSGSIKPGMVYRKYAGVWDGDFFSMRSHTHCARFRERFNNQCFVEGVGWEDTAYIGGVGEHIEMGARAVENDPWLPRWQRLREWTHKRWGAYLPRQIS